MINAKKAICMILSVLLLVGLFAFNGFAADQNATITVTPSATQVAVGETVTVTVSATTDYYAATTSIPVYYDAELFDLVPDSVVTADIFGAGATTPRINTTESGSVVVALTPKTRDGNNPTAQILNNTTLFTFQLTAKATGVSLVALRAEDQKTENTAGNLYCGAYASSEITSEVTMVGQSFTFVNAEVTIESATPNTLAIKDNASFEPFIDYTNCGEYTASIYGIDTLGWNADFAVDGALADFLTTTLGDEYLRITTPGSGVETTGTVLEVLDADGETVLEAYVFIYFGDVDGDGVVSSSDDFVASYYELNYEGISTLEQFMAADLDGDCWPTSMDGFTMSYFELAYEGMPTQMEVAALAYNNTYERI